MPNKQAQIFIGGGWIKGFLTTKTSTLQKVTLGFDLAVVQAAWKPDNFLMN